MGCALGETGYAPQNPEDQTPESSSLIISRSCSFFNTGLEAVRIIVSRVIPPDNKAEVPQI